MLTIKNSSKFKLEGFKNIIIVPETFSHNYERFLCEEYSNSISQCTEVITFSRISQRIFAEIGGFANNYINDSGRILAMYNAINLVFDELKIYNSNKIEIITKILATIDEFKIYKIDENKLLEVSNELEEGTLKNKILDLYCIYCAYNKITSNEICDPRQELDFLCENFHKSTIYNNFNVYFDKFDGFTPQQYNLLLEFLKKNINVTIVLDIKDNKEKLYDLSTTAKNTLKNLERMCKINNIEMKNEICENDFKKFEEISQNIFEFNEISIENKDIHMHVSTTIQNECLYTAGKIIDIISKNSDIRYRDIVVSARNFDEYSEQLKVAFDRFDIPVFVSNKDDITKKPPIRLIISALNMILHKYKTQNVFEYLKCPTLEIPFDDLCILEDYVLRWNIKYITKKQIFKANPSFTLRKVDEDEQEKLNWLNEFKNTSISNVVSLDEDFKECDVGADFIKVLYNFCENIGLAQKIYGFQTENLELKQQYDQLWEIIIDSFNQFIEISGNQEMKLEDFVKLYKTLISSYEVAEIPSSIDNVSAGSFERIIGEKCKILFILGADDSNLPANVAENPILNDNDRETLEFLDLEMSPFGSDLVIREFELISNVFNIPTNEIYMSFSEISKNKNTASSIFKRIVDIVKDIEVTTDLGVNYDFMFKSKKTALEQLAIHKNREKIGEISSEIFESNIKPIIDKDILEKIYSKSISPSRIDIQTSCRFRYFMQFGLKAKPRKIVKFNQAENGNFIHFILEKTLSNTDYENRDVSQYVDEYIENYSSDYFSENMTSDPKFAYILDRLKKNTYRIVKNIIEEIKASEFKPQSFELEISYSSAVKPIKVGNFSVIGKVDRVDVYKEDDKTFLRIIDYKSGVKKLDLSTLYYGINMQMLIYLIALENSRTYYDGASASGALYIPTKIPKILMDAPIGDKEIEEKVNKELKRSGILVEDKEIIEKMEKNNPFLYLPVKVNKDNTFSKSSTSITSEIRFEAIKKFVSDKLVEITDEVLSGKTTPNPYVYDNRSSCDYCEFSASCGFSTSYDSKKTLEKLKDQEFWEKLGV